MARLQTTTQSLSLSNGERQARAWNLRVVEPVPYSSQAVAKGSLYVLLELGGEHPASPRLYRLLLNTIQGVYYDGAGGISGGITDAILAAHQALQQQNAVHPEEEQLGGVSCVVLRGEELYMGIGGPATVLVGHPGRVEQFPAEISPTVAPLGGAETPTIELFHTSVLGETKVIQLQSEWSARLPSRKLAAAALAGDIENALEYLEGLAPTNASLSALALHLTPAPAETAAAIPAAPAPESQSAADAPSSEDVGEAEAWAAAAAPAAEAESDTAEAASQALTLAKPLPATSKPQRGRLWWMLIAVPVIAVALIALALWWQQRALQQEFESLLQGAQAALGAATAPDAPAEVARAQLDDAQERLRAALDLRPGNEQASALQATIQTALDKVNAVIPLYKLLTLREVGGSDTDPSRLVVRGNRIYMLDQGLDQIMRYGLDEISGLIPEANAGLVVQRGQTLPEGQVVGELLDIAWAAAGGARRSSNLLALDSNGNLLEVDDALGVRPLAIAGRDQWQSPRLLASYNSNLYLLDSGSGRILRYRPSEDGYSNEPENYFEGETSIDLSQAVDMAIDGNIWVLYGDGTVQTFFQGRQQPFELEQPPNGPITQPQALYVGSEAGTAQSLFIADSGGSRIVEYDKNGKYLRQYRPADGADQDKLRQMAALVVDEVDRFFYLLTSDALLRTDIP